VMVTFVPSFVGPAHAAWPEEEDAERARLEAEYGQGDPRVEAGNEPSHDSKTRLRHGNNSLCNGSFNTLFILLW